MVAPAVDSVTGPTAAVLVAVGAVVLVDVDELVALVGHAGTAIVVVLVDGAASTSSVASPAAASAPAASVSSAAHATRPGRWRRAAMSTTAPHSAISAPSTRVGPMDQPVDARSQSSFIVRGRGRPPTPMLPPVVAGRPGACRACGAEQP